MIIDRAARRTDLLHDFACAIIGTGVIGASMAKVLVDNGARVSAYDIDERARTACAEATGAVAARNLEEAVRESSYIFVSVRDISEVVSVIAGSEGILKWAPKNSILFNLSTISVKTAVDMQRQCGTRDIGYLDAPISGRPPHMTVFVGGDEELYRRATPIFKACAASFTYLGRVGAGTIAKLVNQWCFFSNFLTAVEALTTGTAAGVDPTMLLGALRQA